jgi:hypothetical protein
MLETASTLETSVNFYQTTQRIIPKDSHLRTWHHENLRSHIPDCYCNKEWLCLLSIDDILSTFRIVAVTRTRRPVGRSRHKWEDNIKMDLTEIGLKSVD